MRKTSELLQVLLDNIKYFKSGLCGLNRTCKIELEQLSYDEYSVVKDYILDNRPSMFSSYECFMRRIRRSPYYWPEGDLEPRIKWLEKHIKELQKENR